MRSQSILRSELLLNIGESVAKLERRGKSLLQIADRLCISPGLLEIAKSFHQSPPNRQLRAIAEDWNLSNVHRSLMGVDLPRISIRRRRGRTGAFAIHNRFERH